jgi:hypothetical protein
MSDKREFVDFISDSDKVAIAVKGQTDEENFIEEFEDYESITDFLRDNPDVPKEIGDSMYAQQLTRNTPQRQPEISSSEAKYLISARHVELENMIVAGTKPTKEYFLELAKKDLADFAKLDANGRKAIQDDLKNAASLSKDYAEATKEIDLVEPEEEATLRGETLEQTRKRLAANFVAPLEEDKANTFVVKRSGSELDKNVFVKPIAIGRDYEEIGLEYHLKGRNLTFRLGENGNTLHTTTPDKKIVADMVAMAKAKQWSNIKLSGSVEFRREAWLQAESQGIKTTGYTPKAEDKEQLAALMAQRRENSITNVETKDKNKVAPRKDSTISESILQTNAKLNIATNLMELSSKEAYKNRKAEELTKIAEMRSLLMEDLKSEGSSAARVEESLASFDKHFEEPRNLEAIIKESESLQEIKLPAKKAQEQEQGL